MKSLAIITLAASIFLAPFAYSATHTDNQQMHCLRVGYAYKEAAFFRDHGMSPQQTFKALAALKKQIGESNLKKIINNVFFNPAFTYAGGDALMNQIEGICLGLTPYKPLR